MFTQDENVRHVLRSIAALCVIAAGFGAGLYAWDAHRNGPPLPELSPASGEAVAGGEQIGNRFTLVDQDGNPVTQDVYGDTYHLVFFGFTYCPDICPATMKKLSSVLEEIGPRGKDLRILFITTDPENDTPEAMKAYLKEYDPRFTGLTGTEEQVRQVIDSFRVYVEKTHTADGNHTINHSAMIYFMGPGNSLIDVFDSADTPETIARAVGTAIPQG